MAVTAKFQADFSSFNDAVDKAQVQLRSFETGASKVETSLTRMSNSLSGAKVIQDATLMAAAVDKVGGVSALTEKELAKVGAQAQEATDKMTKLGIGVPANIQAIADAAKAADKDLAAASKTAESAGLSMSTLTSVAKTAAATFGIAFSGAAAVGFAKSLVSGAFEAADAIDNLSAKTGNSTDQIQRWQFVGAQAKVSIEDFAQASFKLGANLDGGKGSVRDAVEQLGLSYAKLRTQSPDEQFNATIAALERMESPQERNRLAIELFGKSFASIAPAVAQGYTDMAAQANVASDAQVKALDRAGDAWDRFVANRKTGITSELGNLVIAAEELKRLSSDETSKASIWATYAGDLLKYASALGPVSAGVKGLSAIIDGLTASAAKHAAQVGQDLPAQKAQVDATAEYARAMQQAQAVLDGLSGAQASSIASALELGTAHDKIAVDFGLSDAALALFIKHQQEAKQANTEAAAAAKKYGEAIAEISSVGQDYLKTLATIDGETVSAIEYYLKAGVAQDKLAEAYGLTAAQVKAVATELTEATKAQQLSDKATADSTQRWSDFNALLTQMSGSATDKTIADIERWEAAQIKSHVDAKTDTADFYDWLTATEAKMYEKADQDRLLADSHSRAHFEKIAADAEEAYNFALAHSDQFTSGYIDNLRKTMVAADQAAAQWQTSMGGSLDTLADKVQALSGAWETAAEKAKRQAGGGTFNLPELTKQQFDQAGGAQRLQQLKDTYALLPGRAPGGSGPTGILPNDDMGWNALLQEQQLYQELKNYVDKNVSTMQQIVSSPSLKAPALVVPLNGNGGVTTGPINISVSGVLDPATIGSLSTAVGQQITRQIMNGVRLG